MLQNIEIFLHLVMLGKCKVDSCYERPRVRNIYYINDFFYLSITVKVQQENKQELKNFGDKMYLDFRSSSNIFSYKSSF